MTIEIGNSKFLDAWAASGAKSEPNTAKKDLGWQSGERPSFQVMNWLQNTVMQKINHILQNGIALWDEDNAYLTNNIVSHNGVVYIALADNTGSEPPGADWKDITSSDALSVLYDNNSSGLAAGTVQAALDEIVELIDLLSDAIDDFGNPSDYATSAQGAKADTALQPGQGGKLVDLAYAEYSTYGTTLAQIPLDNSKPQITEGVEILSATITPKKTTNKIRATVSGMFSTDVGGVSTVIALFDGGSDALKTTAITAPAAGYIMSVAFDLVYTPGVTTAKTFSVRVGRGQPTFTVHLNGVNGVGMFFNGSSKWTLTLEEIAA
ncbi:hypothetical protein ACFSC6_12330 [Rufibacter sediminis]|uniref:Chitin-binding type-3 domain-containing protein n=1 Tax=Rufibacter sediminis TaxID=2762756 RepID=A0ABR6VU46_9BACT|nr:hypothetical protein [Rufibacter sediminis]MBC3540670.1 hypothetical protein [Rufibacter sediminis]